MGTQKEQVQNLFAKIQNQPLTDDKLKMVTNWSKEIENILEDIKPRTSRTTQILIDTVNNLLQANYETVVGGGMDGCPECVDEAKFLLDRIQWPKASSK